MALAHGARCWCRGSCTAGTIHRALTPVSLRGWDSSRAFVAVAPCTDRLLHLNCDSGAASAPRAARPAVPAGRVRLFKPIEPSALRRRLAPRLHVSHRVVHTGCKTTALRPLTLCIIRLQQDALLQQRILSHFEAARVEAYCACNWCTYWRCACWQLPNHLPV
jgi:hypothetical protein